MSQKIKVYCIIASNFSQVPNLKKAVRSVSSITKYLGKTSIKICTDAQDHTGVKHPHLFGRESIEIIPVRSPAGFSTLNNAGLDKIALNSKHLATDSYVLFLNDDALLATDFGLELRKLLLKSGRKTPDVIVPIVFEEDEKVIDSYGVEYFTSGYAKNSRSLDLPTSLASASCLLVKLSFIQKMKRAYGFYFNPIYFFYLEDVDFMLRAFMLGAKVHKLPTLRAYHKGSSTSGKRSRFTMHHTYRNILWLIFCTWPVTVILSHLASIILVQGWVLLYSTWKFGPLMYLQLLGETFINFPILALYRKKTLGGYGRKQSFEKAFSPFAFRTYHNVTIPSLTWK